MAKLCLGKDGIKQVQALLDFAEDNAGELTAAQIKLKKQCLRAAVPITHASAKGKGRDLQHFVCREIAAMTGLDYTQNDDQCLIHSREMGQAGTDVVLRGKASEFFPFSVECKNTESFSLWPTVDQATANEKPGTDFFIVHKKKGREPVAIMAWESFRKWYTKKGYLK